MKTHFPFPFPFHFFQKKHCWAGICMGNPQAVFGYNREARNSAMMMIIMLMMMNIHLAMGTSRAHWLLKFHGLLLAVLKLLLRM